MSIKDTLLTVSQRETGGQTAQDRFDYQTAWGLSRLMDLHSSGSNYAVAFEFHDDVVTLDDADEPTKAIFYQVKTKRSGSWSIAQFTNRTGPAETKKSSYAGKMFDNFTRLGPAVEKLVLVSNLPFPEVTELHEEKCFTTIDDKKIAKFASSLAIEAANFSPSEHIGLFHFIFSDLNLSNYEATIIGRVAEFLDVEIGSHIPPKPFALMLNDYCRRRSKSSGDLISFEQLKISKFVTREDMMGWLSRTQDQHQRRPEWIVVATDLDLPFPEKRKIARAWLDYETMIRARTNTATMIFTQRLQDIIHKAVDNATNNISLIDLVISEIRPIVYEWNPGSDDAFVKAAILYELQR
ncbi:dsDNA nuclease domain-containing protein [Paracoccus liaowanqingii]|uniref:dsDNA nuclease domain-containing protein n=1 Tax=Paracoccus liaowanqingii TaxID=2560053 RepID=UPI00143D7DDF|nr:dsDNA nuclease domain-containing protein [Paracoccus liaowanqingii]